MYRFMRLARVLLVTLSVFGGISSLAAQEASRTATEVFTLDATSIGDGGILLKFAIAGGNYLYRDSIEVTLDGERKSLELPAGDMKEDPNFGKVEIYRDRVRARLAGLPRAGVLAVHFQGCAEAGICYPPIVKTLDLATLAVTDDRPQTAAIPTMFEPLEIPAPVGASPPVDDAATFMAASPVTMLPGFLGFGLLLSLTPCVFPMIPILSAMLGGAGGRLTAWRGFALSASYVLAMAAAYGLVGLVAGWSGANIQALLQTPWMLGFSALVFVALAFAMFGGYELQLPAGIASRLSRGRKGGSLAGAALLGFGSALIVGPCVTPPLAAAMLYAVQTGDAARGGAALFALGLGMGLPLIAAGTFGAKVLPRSGPWLAFIRQAFGVVFLGVATMLATRLMPGPAALAVWGAFSIGTAVFAGAFDRLDAASRSGRRFGKAAGLVAALYGAVMIVGAAGGGEDPLRPLAFVSRAGSSMPRPAETRIVSLAGLDAAVEEQSGEGKPVLVSFTADWCTICKANEKLMGLPQIRSRLANVPIIRADVTKQGEDERALMSRFSVIGPPVLFLIDDEGREVPGSRLTGPVTIEDIARRLDTAGA